MTKPKKIAVNVRFLIKGKLEGIGLFTYETLKLIVRDNPDVEFYFLFDRAYDPEFIFGPNVKPVVLFPQARHPFLWFWWFEVAVANWLNKNKPDLFLSTDGFASLRGQVPQVIVLHDLAFEHFKEHTPVITRAYYQHYIPRFAHKAARIATVSQFSKSDIIKQYGIKPSLIDVVYNAAKEVYKPVDLETQLQTKQRIANGCDYFVYVGSIHPRKNVARMLTAFDIFKHQTGSSKKMVIVGRMAWDYKDVDDTLAKMKHRDDVIFLGHVEPEELGRIVASAYAMVYVSLFEGFGIPIVEALSCHIPVITSNLSSMPEAAGDAAILVDPTSTNDIADAMVKIVGNKQLYNSLVERGQQQLKKFSWQLSADKLWQSCLKAYNK